jgi:hypothetical protein
MLKWLVALLGLLLVAAGSFTAMQGWSIVQVERGWSQVIAGSAIATGGFIILALAAVAARIDALHASVDQIRRNALPVETPAPVRVEAPAQDRARPAAPKPQPPPQFDPDLAAPKPPPPAAPPRFEPEPPAIPSEQAAAPEPEPEPEQAIESAEPAAARPRPGARVRSSWLPRSKAADGEARERRGPPAFPAVAYRAIPPRETDLPTGAWPPVEAPPSAPSEGAIFESLNEPAATPAGPALVRRFESGGVGYQLFSDGSIEAQTESGSYRFASLAELRAFIESKR